MAKITRRQAAFQSLGLIILSLSLYGVLSQLPHIQTLFSQASGEPAQLIIDTQGVLGTLPTPWRYLAQGGESPQFQFTPILDKLKPLKPTSIRLDHLFDFYIKVSKDSSGELVLDFSQLDLLLKDLQELSITPFLSLSYMPPSLSQTGDVTDLPNDWRDWEQLVTATVEHISGRDQLNIDGVYYEVWNEPDLFGQFKTYGPKNYLTLYQHTANAVTQAKNTNSFKLGGPATTNLYANWLTRFMDFVSRENLRLDFYSWHLYSDDPEAVTKSYRQFDTLMRQYPEYFFSVAPVISEWGPDSQINPLYDQAQAGAHAIHTYISLPPQLDQVFLFEIQDGLDPQGQTFWGRWGLLSSVETGSQLKPRFQTLTYLNQLGTQQLSVVGHGSWVKALATKNEANEIKAIIANYDPKEVHHEASPITFIRLESTTYQLKIESLLNPLPLTFNITPVNQSYSHLLDLPPNSVFLLTLTPVSTQP